ncbi:hypothetical protein QBC36DRAFT_379224 [Triangularia setosa]|uniref:Uncharacterized protein n=1 Tax=Triangularia setosa TaxID=2587417 RepID=A0AAN6W5U8_9PEZI|nr:hypothetical protein QBC36DRAFT_379224 [Podospora setosa]
MFFKARHKSKDAEETSQKLDHISTKLNDIDVKLFTINNHLNNLDSVRYELEANIPLTQPAWPPAPPMVNVLRQPAHSTQPQQHQREIDAIRPLAEPLPPFGSKPVHVFSVVIFACLFLFLSWFFRKES